MSTFDYMLIFCGGWAACEIFRFIRKEIKSNLKKKEKRVRGISERQHQIIAGAIAGRPTAADVRDILLKRTSVDTSNESDDSFRVYLAADGVRAEDYFFYVIQGMKFPFISKLNILPTGSFYITIGGESFCFHTGWQTKSTLGNEVKELFEQYVKDGCPIPSESVENIVERARERNLGQIDPLDMFGFKFAEDV